MSNLVDIICIIDKSGSMHDLESDTIGGYNRFLDSQKSLEGMTRITTVLFNDRHETLFSGVPLEKAYLNNNLYQTGGMTALLDAVGTTLTKEETRIRTLDAAEKPARVIAVIITDGLENSSREYTYGKIKNLIESLKREDWKFEFLGANIDVAHEGAKMGLERKESVKYESTKDGTFAMYNKLCCDIADIRKKDE